MGSVRWRNFTKGWWGQGADDAVPANTLRRAVGIASVKTTALSSRWGSPLVAPTNAHSIMRYNDRRFYGTEGDLLRDDLTVIASHLFNRLTFLRMPPQVGKPDYCFVASGSKALKIDPDTSATKWGIAAPVGGAMTAAKLDNLVRVIDNMDDVVGWVPTDSTLTMDTLIMQHIGSLKMEVAPSTLGLATKDNLIHLDQYENGVFSPIEDFIAVWVRVDNPANLEFLELAFDVTAGGFVTGFYQKKIEASTQIPASHQLVTQTSGIADNPALGTTQGTWVTDQGEVERTYFVPFDNPQQLTDAQQQAGQTSISTAIGTWVRLRLPKSTFQRAGGGPQSWENVHAVRLAAKTNAQGPVTVYWENLDLVGGAGLQGRYQYYATFANSRTGSTSNSFPDPVTVEDVQRQPVQLNEVPVSPDPQVDQRWIFRTVGNGTIPFRVAIIPDNSTNFFVDRVADFFGLDSDTTLLMSNVQLQFDNDPPTDAWQDTWGPFAGRAWWARSTITGERGRVFYSPRGRPEAVEGFLDVSSDDDPTVKGVAWNAANYVFTENRIFQIVGPDAGPFIAREIHGAPGTTEAFAVAATPRGIAYVAQDGPRLFNGIQSTLISPDACVLIFRGETLEGTVFKSIPPIIGGYVRDEYILSDQYTTVAVNLIDGTWRVPGVPMQAFYYEPDTGSAVVTLYNRVVLFETEGQLVDGRDIPIPLDWQTPAAQTDEAHVGLVQRLYIEMDTARQSIQVAIELDGAVIPLPAFQTEGRTTQEWSIGRTGRVVSVRLHAQLVRRVTLYGIKLDVHVGAAAVPAPAASSQ